MITTRAPDGANNIKYEEEDNHDPGKGGNTSYDNRDHLNLNEIRTMHGYLMMAKAVISRPC